MSLTFKLAIAAALSIEFFGQLAKVITYCGQPHHLREFLVMPGKGAAQISPELATRAVAHAERQHDAKESHHVVGEPVALRLGRARDYPLQTIERALIIFSGAIDGAHDRFIAFDETRGVHLRGEV